MTDSQNSRDMYSNLGFGKGDDIDSKRLRNNKNARVLSARANVGFKKSDNSSSNKNKNPKK